MALDNWNISENQEISYITESFSNSNPALLSVQKTYDEGIDVIRSIHQMNDKYIVVVSTESRSSGPSETMEAECSSFEEAQSTLESLCEEDDEFYE